MVKFKVTNQFWDTHTKKMIKADSVLELSENVAEKLYKQNLGYITTNEEVIVLSEPELETIPEKVEEPILEKKSETKNKNKK